MESLDGYVKICLDCVGVVGFLRLWLSHEIVIFNHSLINPPPYPYHSLWQIHLFWWRHDREIRSTFNPGFFFTFLSVHLLFNWFVLYDHSDRPIKFKIRWQFLFKKFYSYDVVLSKLSRIYWLWNLIMTGVLFLFLWINCITFQTWSIYH